MNRGQIEPQPQGVALEEVQSRGDEDMAIAEELAAVSVTPFEGLAIEPPGCQAVEIAAVVNHFSIPISMKKADKPRSTARFVGLIKAGMAIPRGVGRMYVTETGK